MVEIENKDGVAIIPEGVTEIAGWCFFGCEDMKGVVIPDSVEIIGQLAFYNCMALTSIRLPKSLRKIGDYAFDGCKNLKSVTIPASVEKIGKSAFCSYNLQSIVVEEGNKRYDSRDNCNAIIETKTNKLIVGCANTVIPESVKKIDYSAFWGCAGLKSLVIPNAVKEIPNGSIISLTNLQSLSVAEGNKRYDSRDNCNAVIETKTNKLIVGCASTVIPNTVVEIGEAAFHICERLKSVTIPDSVKKIGNSAFRICDGLESVTIGKSVSELGEKPFDECKNIKSIVVSKFNDKYDSRDNCNAIIETMANKLIFGCANTVIPDTVKVIGNKAFDDCVGLKTIRIPDSVITIEECAFNDCRDLESITYGKSVQDISLKHFFLFKGLRKIIVSKNNRRYDSRNNCNAVIETKTDKLVFGCVNTVIPDSVREIGDNALASCTGLKTIRIPNSVTRIGESAFVSDLENITIGKAVQDISSESFSMCKNIQSIVVVKDNPYYDSRDNCNAIIETKTNKLVLGCKNTIIPDSVVEIGDEAFSSAPESIIIPDSVTRIGDRAFGSDLENITIGKSVQDISWRSFYDCERIQSIVVVKDNPYYDSRDNCNAIIETKTNKLIVGCASTVIPDTVVEIGDEAFSSVPESITIPDSVKKIGYSVFGFPENLNAIYISAGKVNFYKNKLNRYYHNLIVKLPKKTV